LWKTNSYGPSLPAHRNPAFPDWLRSFSRFVFGYSRAIASRSLCSSQRALEGLQPKINLRITTMKTTLRFACLSAALLALMLPLAAQTAPNALQTNPTPPTPKPPTINQRLENQQDRIGQGINSGQLTAGEAANLETKGSAITKEVQADRQASG
jgi:hypothetical protein